MESRPRERGKGGTFDVNDEFNSGAHESRRAPVRLHSCSHSLFLPRVHIYIYLLHKLFVCVCVCSERRTGIQSEILRIKGPFPITW